ncbi:MAG TPA: hypothetical protein VL020_05770 [Pseudomonadales bacterium]|nr:hypothetical protein [Pseudomonadales bacterium]
MTIKAIQTQYKGYHFRSRLEARWAVFFDALGISWEYEMEGFELSTGERYLPDFYLPEANLWLEIKGPKPTENELQKCITLQQDLRSSKGFEGKCVSQLMVFDNNLRDSIPREIAVEFFTCGYSEPDEKLAALGEDTLLEKENETRLELFKLAYDAPKVCLASGGKFDNIFCIAYDFAVEGCSLADVLYFLFPEKAGRPIRFKQGIFWLKISEAAKKAMSARFEHGDSPK